MTSTLTSRHGNKEVKALLFDDYLRVTNNEKQGVQSLVKFFTPVTISK